MGLIADTVFLVAVQPIYNVLLLCYWLTFQTSLGFALIPMAVLAEAAKLPLLLRMDLDRWHLPVLNERRLKLRDQFSDDDAYGEHLRALCEAAGYSPYRSSYLIAITIAIWILLLMAIRLFAQADGGRSTPMLCCPCPSRIFQ